MPAKMPFAQARDDRLLTLEFLRQLRGLVAFHQTIGVDGYPRSQALSRFIANALIPEEIRASGVKPSSCPALKRPAEAKPVSPPVSGGLSVEICECHSCHLGRGETGDQRESGISNVKLILVADNFSKDNEQADKPSHEESEQLLERMLAAIGLGFKDVHPLSLQRCVRGQWQGQEACLPYLRGEIALHRPRIICIMGQLASQILLKSKLPLHRQRGRFHNLDGIPTIVTYHPEFLLKNPEMKKAAWQDLQLIQKKLQAEN